MDPTGLTAVDVCMGSSDPHGLRLDDDRAPTARKRPTFALGAHDGADALELSRRPVARFNTPEQTTAEPPPSAVPGAEPPEVRSLADVLLPEALRAVRRWERRLRRCLRLARLGHVSQARRMRPPDLWLPATSSMRAEAAPWDWDMRPLARGEVATPLQPSSRDGAPPMTGLILEAIRQSDPGFADQAIVAEMLDGIRDDVECERGSFLCAPHAGAIDQLAVASGKLDAQVELGFSESYAELPFWPIRCDPYSIVDESVRAGMPKYRLTNDHSWPKGKAAPSLNGSMDRSRWPAATLPRVRQMAEATAILQTSGAPVRMSVFDCKAFYKVMGRQLAEIWRNGAACEGGYIVDLRCCFGSAADAAKCARISNFLIHHLRQELQRLDAKYPTRDPVVLEWLAKRRAAGEAAGASEAEMTECYTCMHACSMYVDDGACATIDDLLYDCDGRALVIDGRHVRRARLHFRAAQRLLERFGHQSELSKQQPPTFTPQLLGVDLDLIERRMRLSASKRKRYAAEAARVAAMATCPKAEYVELLCKLNYAATCYPLGRQWLHASWRAARAAFRTCGGAVVVTKHVREDLQRWIDELKAEGHEGVPLAARATFPSMGEGGCGAIYADASGEGGFCAWTIARGELLFIEGEWEDGERVGDGRLLIADLELAASTWGLVALAPAAELSFVYSFTDNVVAQAAMAKLTPSTAASQRLTTARVDWLRAHGVSESAQRITSKANLWSDLGSRRRLDEMRRQAAQLGLPSRRVPVPAGWRGMLGSTEALA